MTKMISLGLAAMASALAASPVHALSNRISVSGHGTDAAGCSAPASPCRSFQYAHDNLVAGGEIDVLDPAGYGPINITKALSIVNDGVGTVGVQPAVLGQNAVTIAVTSNDTVYLRGPNIDGLGTGSRGIQLDSGSLTMVNCVIQHFFGYGVVIAPSAGPSSAAISNTIVSYNASGGIFFSRLEVDLSRLL
jgi:hypothetical protein